MIVHMLKMLVFPVKDRVWKFEFFLVCSFLLVFLECLIRLVGGDYEWEGIVEVRIEGQWLPVCDNSWDRNDSLVACHQLGYDNVLHVGTFNYVGGDRFWLDHLMCSGQESLLCECPSAGIGKENCGRYQGASVTCACK